MNFKILTAKFRSRCIANECLIRPGDTIYYQPGEGARCEACGKAHAAPEEPAPVMSAPIPLQEARGGVAVREAPVAAQTARKLVLSSRCYCRLLPKNAGQCGWCHSPEA